MSETFGYWVYVAGDARAAATIGRRYAYRDGWAGLRVVEASEHLNRTRTGRLAGLRYFRVMLIAAEQRVGDQTVARKRSFELRHRWPAGTRVRTAVEGVDYSDGRRHTMPAGAAGMIVGRSYPNFRVRFSGVAGRTFLYAPQDLEALP